MYSLLIVVSALYFLLLALAPLTLIPSRAWGVILTGVLASYLFPTLPGALIVCLTLVFGLFVWAKTRQHNC